MPKTGPQNGSALLAQLHAAVPTREANNLLKVDYYYRSAELLQRQAQQYRKQHDQAQLYIMLMRLASLVVETIPKHQQYSATDPRYTSLRQACVSSVLPELERLKLDLLLKEQTRALLDEEAPWAPLKLAGAVQLSAGTPADLAWPSAAPVAAVVASAAAAPARAALELSPGLVLPAASQATLSKHAVLPALPSAVRAAPASPVPPQLPTAPRPLYPELIDLGESAVQPALPQQQPQQPPEAGMAALDLSAAPAWQPPAQPDGFALGPEQQQAALAPSPYHELVPGPQEVGVRALPLPSGPPQPGDTCALAPPDGSAGALAAPAQQRRRGPKRQSVRDVHVSVALLNEFMRFAAANTRRGVETCGMLAGTLSTEDAVFTITTLVVPKQHGTSDSVEMLNEEEMVDVILGDPRGLYPLGWIHTHPTQSCFLSSIDVHTQAGFQTQMDESVAIVMAPTDASKRVGIFRLTTPGGLRLVQGCQLRGFHPHPATDTGQPLYELCGHVYLNPRAQFSVVDLR